MTRYSLRIEVSTGFVVFLCAYYYIDTKGTFFPFVLSAMFHELGHVLTLLCVGGEVRSLKLTACGAVIDTNVLSYWREAVVAMMGPGVNFLLLLICRRSAPLLAVINLCLFLYNMLPIYPLDGGRVLRSVLRMMLPMRIALWVEKTICGLCLGCIMSISVYLTCVWHAGLWPVLLCGVLLTRSGAVFSDRKAYKNYKRKLD